MGGKSDGGGSEAAYARMEEAQRQARIREGTASINKTFDDNFTEQFFGEQRDNYLAYAQPQLIDQYGKAKDQLAFALSRAGVTDSSMAGAKAGELETLNALRARELADKAAGYETTARNNVEQARAELINNLNVTGDAAGAANAAVNRAGVLSRPAEYSPLTQAFSEFLSGLGTQAAFERSYALGSPVKPRYDTGLFGGGGNSVRSY